MRISWCVKQTSEASVNNGGADLENVGARLLCNFDCSRNLSIADLLPDKLAHNNSIRLQNIDILTEEQ